MSKKYEFDDICMFERAYLVLFCFASVFLDYIDDIFKVKVVGYYIDLDDSMSIRIPSLLRRTLHDGFLTLSKFFRVSSCFG